MKSQPIAPLVAVLYRAIQDKEREGIQKSELIRLAERCRAAQSRTQIRKALDILKHRGMIDFTQGRVVDTHE